MIQSSNNNNKYIGFCDKCYRHPCKCKYDETRSIASASSRPLAESETNITNINYSSNRQLLDLRSRIVMEFIEKGRKAK